MLSAGNHLSDSARSFDFTRNAARQIEQVIGSLAHLGDDSDTIYHYLLGTEAVPFHSYLKRWLYRESGLTEPFAEVPDAAYQDMILRTFHEHHTPFSWEPTSKKPSAIVKGWLSRTQVRRRTIFLLGFGLGMREDEVSEFLTKAGRDTDFDFYSPEEALNWYCYHQGKSWSERQRLWRASRQWEGEEISPQLFRAIVSNPEKYLFQEDILLAYAAKLHAQKDEARDTAFAAFRDLYAALGESLGGPEHVAGLIERNYCMGIPRNEAGNLRRTDESRLSSVFRNYRLTRQRLHKLLNRSTGVDRLDMITLFFFSCCTRPQRLQVRDFLAACNRMLEEVRMAGMYVCNPYEAFLLLAMNSGEPLDVYSEVWERSYLDDPEVCEACV